MAISIQELERYGISDVIIQKLIPKGYDKLSAIQQKAIEEGLFEGKIYWSQRQRTLEKTFIGELAAIATSKKIGKQRTFYLVPLRALADEKYLEFSNKYEDYGLRIAISTSDRTESDDELLEYDLVAKYSEAEFGDLLYMLEVCCEA